MEGHEGMLDEEIKKDEKPVYRKRRLYRLSKEGEKIMRELRNLFDY